MRMPRARFTVRRMMIVVAVVAITVGAVELSRRRRSAFLQRSSQLRWAEYVEMHGQRRPDVADSYIRLAEKYERAARYPWLPVEPDPPEPE